MEGLGRYSGEREIVLPPKASTRTRLHELAHKRLGHEPGRMTVSEFVDREIEAEVFAWEAMDKELNPRVGGPALMALIEDYDFSNEEALELVVGRLEAVGIQVSEADRKDLWRFLEWEK